MPVCSNKNFGNNNNQQMRQSQQPYGRARVNHINAQEAQEAQGVVLGDSWSAQSWQPYYLIREHRTHSYPQVLWKSIAYLQYY
jgi:hypothetical protein